MPCYHPLEAWRSTQVNPSGKRPLVFTAAQGFGSALPIPCGRCIGCRLERSRQWALRCVHEAQLHAENCFVTLTYSDEKLPYGGTLIKKHWQDFMKRLRKRTSAKILYFHCGEYGERSRRPHYHACLFGIDFPDKLFYTERNGCKLYTSEALDAIWGHGFCTIGAVTFESAAYVARYVMKKVTGELADKHYEHVEPETGEIIRLPSEYVTMSLKPAVGKTWYERYGADVFPDDSVIIRGREMKPPKYYDKQYELADPEAHKALKEKRLAEARANSWNSTPSRLAVRKEITQAKLNQLKRIVE